MASYRSLTRSPSAALALLVVVALVLLGCGGSDEPDAAVADGEPTTTPLPTPDGSGDAAAEPTTTSAEPDADSATDTQNAPPDATVVGDNDDGAGDGQDAGADSGTAERDGATTDADAPSEPVEVEPRPLPFPSPEDTEPVALDPSIVDGTLDNGLRYLIRRNDSPGLRAEFRLHVDAGSAVETDTQLGGAHFLEHMMFNGTEDYPGNELIDALGSLGSAFGPDLNAYTSFDETVYSLSVPNDDDSMNEALSILEQWAAHALIDPDDVEDERGVILAEWREGLGMQGRAGRFLAEALLGDTAWANRMPIGTEDSIRSITAEELRRFYDDWYRPDLMTVIAVGDFDPSDIEGRIAALFGDLEARGDTPDPDLGTLAVADGPEAHLLFDDELPVAFTEIVFPGPPPSNLSREDLAQSLRLATAMNQIVVRMNERIARGEAPAGQAYFADDTFVQDSWIQGFGVSGSPANMRGLTEALFEEIELVHRFGFNDPEIEQAIEELRVLFEQDRAGAPTKQDSAHAGDLIIVAAGRDRLAGAADLNEMRLDILDAMTEDAVTGQFQALLAERQPLFLGFGPERDADLLWTTDGLVEAWQSIRAAELTPRGESAAVPDALMDAPDSVAIASESALPNTGAREFRFDNGVRVIALQTQISEDLVLFQAVSPGGYSQVAPDDADELILITDVVPNSGVGPHDLATTRAIVRNSFIELWASTEYEYESLNGSAATSDLEVLFQGIHLLMTEPRADDVALAAADDQNRVLITNPELNANLIRFKALTEARFGDISPFALMSVEALDSLGAEDLDLYVDRYGSAGDFTFVFVGDVEPAVVGELAARYLGTLPAGDTGEAVDLSLVPDVPAGVVEREVRGGEGNQASLQLLFTNELPEAEDNPVVFAMLREAMAIVLVDEIREELGATYTPNIELGWEFATSPLAQALITVGADPAEIDDIQTVTVELLAELAEDGLPSTAFDNAFDILAERYRFVSNEDWIGEYREAVLDPDYRVLTPARKRSLLDDISPALLTDAIEALFTADQHIAVRQLPLAG